MSDSNNHVSKNAGFTIVELLVVLSVMMVISLTVFGVASGFFSTLTRNNARTEMTVASQNLLRSTVENLRYGDGIRQSNQIADANEPMGGWSTSNSNFVVIIAVPALDSANNYIIDTNTGSPYMNELVYYKNGATLMRRRLANPSATGNTAATSCPPAIATSSCPADIVLADYVQSMIFTLYDQDGAQTTTPSLARSINIRLEMQRYSGSSKPIDLTTNLRVTLRNRF